MKSTTGAVAAQGPNEPQVRPRWIKISRWSGQGSVRIRIGGLFIGGRWRRGLAAFVIWNGCGVNCGLQTWRP